MSGPPATKTITRYWYVSQLTGTRSRVTGEWIQGEHPTIVFVVKLLTPCSCRYAFAVKLLQLRFCRHSLAASHFAVTLLQLRLCLNVDAFTLYFVVTRLALRFYYFAVSFLRLRCLSRFCCHDFGVTLSPSSFFPLRCLPLRCCGYAYAVTIFAVAMFTATLFPFLFFFADNLSLRLSSHCSCCACRCACRYDYAVLFSCLLYTSPSPRD